MVVVCDAIMGTGKSSAAITYMNEHPNEKFIYITPYLEEATRITRGCPSMHFFEPQKKSEFNGSKTLHTLDLVQRGENVATTHQAFKFYPQELLDTVKKQGYTLIIDENVDVLETLDADPADIKMTVDAGYVGESDGGIYSLTKDVYNGETHRDLFRILHTRDIIKVATEDRELLYYWQLPPELITSFKNVFILTYLFKGQGLHHFMEMYDIPYEYIGIDRDAYGVCRFSSSGRYVPQYTKILKDKIHVVNNEKLNDVGRDKYSLSMRWFTKSKSDVPQLKNNLYNYFFNIHKGTPADRKMWSTYKEARTRLQGKGYTKGFVQFNRRATNEFRGRDVIAYCVNLYMNVGQKLFYQNNGVDVNEDEYALSTMVQWVWRSAIRDGNDIWLYLPSKRMRDIFTNWIEEVSLGVNMQ